MASPAQGATAASCLGTLTSPHAVTLLLPARHHPRVPPAHQLREQVAQRALGAGGARGGGGHRPGSKGALQLVSCRALCGVCAPLCCLHALQTCNGTDAAAGTLVPPHAFRFSTCTATGRLSSASPNLQAVTKCACAVMPEAPCTTLCAARLLLRCNLVPRTRQLACQRAKALPLSAMPCRYHVHAAAAGSGPEATGIINIRDAFVAAPGHVLLSADYSQVRACRLRLGALKQAGNKLVARSRTVLWLPWRTRRSSCGCWPT